MDPAEPTTEQLLGGWHEGDSDCLEQLVQRHLPWLQNQVRRRLGPELRSKGDTVDYVQDAVVEFLRYGPRFVARGDVQFRSLLLKIVENSLRKKHRWYQAARREIARDQPLPTSTVLSLNAEGASDRTPTQSADRHEREAWVRLAMELLSEDDREILVLRLWKDQSFVEIGEELGLSANAARMRHHRALRRLSLKTDELRRSGLPGE